MERGIKHVCFLTNMRIRRLGVFSQLITVEAHRRAGVNVKSIQFLRRAAGDTLAAAHGTVHLSKIVLD
jgi:hypothetical protein